jgi:hypothetical protein
MLVFVGLILKNHAISFGVSFSLHELSSGPQFEGSAIAPLVDFVT